MMRAMAVTFGACVGIGAFLLAAMLLSTIATVAVLLAARILGIN
jgi:hypothetical protein